MNHLSKFGQQGHAFSILIMVLFFWQTGTVRTNQPENLSIDNIIETEKTIVFQGKKTTMWYQACLRF